MSPKRERLDPTARLASRLPALVGPHLERVWAAAEQLEDPAAMEQHHALRIAVKGLRYELEAWEGCLPPRVARAIPRFKRLQDRLGELHDMDVRADGLVRLLREHGRLVSRALRAVEGRGAAHPELGPAALAVAHAAGDVPVAGLGQLLARTHRERTALHATIVARWQKLERSGLRAKLTKALARAD